MSITQDTDGDFLPDVVEWACMSNASRPDTDLDGVSDFVEVVQRSSPHRPGTARARDHEMRTVVTAVDTPWGRQTHLHVLLRFMGPLSLLQRLDTWFELPSGVRISLNSLVGCAGCIEQRIVPEEGLWVHLRVPLVHEQVLRTLLPFTMGADATIGTRCLRTAVPLFDRDGVTCSLVAFDDGLAAVQSIGLLPAAAQGGGGSESNRVCVMRLQTAGSGPGGTIVRVVDAECVDYNDLTCGSSCAESIGTTFFVPGGVEVITGG